MNKRAIALFEWVVAIGLVLVLIYGLSTLSGKYSQFSKDIGQKQYEVLQAINDGEKALFFLDTSLSQSVRKAYAQQHNVSFGCGTFRSSPLITQVVNGNIEQCDSSSKHQASLFVNRTRAHFKTLLLTYNQHHHISLPLGGYSFALDTNQLTVTSSLALEVPIAGKQELRDDRFGADTIDAEERKDTITVTPTKQIAQHLDVGSEEFIDLKTLDIACTKTPCLLKSNAAKKLVQANELAKEQGFELQVYSPYRSLQRQIEIWESSSIDDERARRSAICYPYVDANHPFPNPEDRCPHITGGAVDLRILGKKQNAFMTPSDWIRVEQVMCKAGFVRYQREVWHFEYGTSRWQRAQQASGGVSCALI